MFRSMTSDVSALFAYYGHICASVGHPRPYALFRRAARPTRQPQRVPNLFCQSFTPCRRLYSGNSCKCSRRYLPCRHWPSPRPQWLGNHITPRLPIAWIVSRSFRGVRFTLRPSGVAHPAEQRGDAQNQQRCPKVGCACNRDADAAEQRHVRRQTSGTFGRKTSVALGMIHPAIPPSRRQPDAARGALSRFRVAVWQQWRVFTRAPPPIHRGRLRPMTPPSAASRAFPRQRTGWFRNDHGSGPIPS